jgi:hypothetical protein
VLRIVAEQTISDASIRFWMDGRSAGDSPAQTGIAVNSVEHSTNKRFLPLALFTIRHFIPRRVRRE